MKTEKSEPSVTLCQVSRTRPIMGLVWYRGQDRADWSLVPASHELTEI